MFQIEPVLWLQSLESPVVTWLMTTITQLGYTPVYAILIIVLIFGIRLKQGFFIFMALLICGILTGGLKDSLKFPRPSDVDIRVTEPGFQRPPLLVADGGAKTFWSLPSPEAMEATRIQTDWSYGLPSGHVSSAAVFFLALAFFFRSRGALVFAVCWIILMALSRMYLGRHFIADVLGGMGVGVFAVAFAIFLFRPLIKGAEASNIKSLLRWAVFVLLLVVLAPFFDLLDKENIGRQLGLLVSYGVLLRVRMPSDKAKVWERIARVMIVFLLYILVDQIINPYIESTGMDDNSMGMLVTVFLITFASFTGSILISKRLKLFKSIEEPALNSA